MSNIQEIKEKTLDAVESKVEELQENGAIDFPDDFSARNSLKSAWLALQNHDQNVLQKCTKESIQNALLDTVVQGLNPAKSQVWYIPYGDTLVAQRSYFGDVLLAKRMANVKEVRSNVIYEGDELNVETHKGRQIVANHTQSFDNIDNDNVAGAYAVVIFKDDRPDRYTIMKRQQIEAAWSQGNWKKDKDNEPHNKFSAQMARKTVVHRACKPLINSSGDDHLFQVSKSRSEVEKAKKERDDQVEGSESEVIDVSGDGEDTSGVSEAEEGKTSGNGNEDTLLDPEDEKSDIAKEADRHREF